MNDETFSIICERCGLSTRISIKNIAPTCKYGEFVFDNSNIKIESTGFDGEIGVICVCGNEVKEGF